MKLKKSMKKKIAKKWALGNIRNIREKQKAEICVKIHIFFVYKGLESVDLQKMNRKQMFYQLKRNYNTQRINFLLFANIEIKKQMLKKYLKKNTKI